MHVEGCVLACARAVSCSQAKRVATLPQQTLEDTRQALADAQAAAASAAESAAGLYEKARPGLEAVTSQAAKLLHGAHLAATSAAAEAGEHGHEASDDSDEIGHQTWAAMTAPDKVEQVLPLKLPKRKADKSGKHAAPAEKPAD